MKKLFQGLVALLLIAGVAQAWNLRQGNEGSARWERNLPDQTIQEIDVGEHYLTVEMSDFTRFMSAQVIIPITYAEIVRVQGVKNLTAAPAGGDTHFSFWVSQSQAGAYNTDLTQITNGTTGIRFRSVTATVQTFTPTATQQRIMRGAHFIIQSDGNASDSSDARADFTITVRPRRQ